VLGFQFGQVHGAEGRRTVRAGMAEAALAARRITGMEAPKRSPETSGGAGKARLRRESLPQGRPAQRPIEGSGIRGCCQQTR
jgi:hypothetical protein